MSSPGRRWFEQRADFVTKPRLESTSDSVPDLFSRCPECGELTYTDALATNFKVCPACEHHLRISADERVAMLADAGPMEFHE